MWEHERHHVLISDHQVVTFLRKNTNAIKLSRHNTNVIKLSRENTNVIMLPCENTNVITFSRAARNFFARSVLCENDTLWNTGCSQSCMNSWSTKRGQVLSIKAKCSISRWTTRCLERELHWKRWWDDRAQRVWEGVQQSEILRYWCAHLKIPKTSKRTTWKVPWAREKWAISCTARCSKLELHRGRWSVAGAQRVWEGVQQSEILMCALENT